MTTIWLCLLYLAAIAAIAAIGASAVAGAAILAVWMLLDVHRINRSRDDA